MLYYCVRNSFGLHQKGEVVIAQLLEVGDQVSIKVSKERREWGELPYQDGTIGTIVGFDETPYDRTDNLHVEVGVYRNFRWPLVRLGTETNGTTHFIYCHYIQLTDKEEHERRVQGFHSLQHTNPETTERVEYIRELPETDLCVGDYVYIRGGNIQEKAVLMRGDPPHKDDSPAQTKRIYVIKAIIYSNIMKPREGEPCPIYNVGDPSDDSWTAELEAKDVFLKERGELWLLKKHGLSSFSFPGIM